MLILFETAAGYALFKLQDESKLADANNVFKEFSDTSKRSNLLQLYKFEPFADVQEASEAIRSIQDTDKLHKSLSKFLKKNIVKKKLDDSLAVIDAKLGGLIRDKFNINIVHNSAIMELQRGLREHVLELLAELTSSEDDAMKLGLSHALCRHKLQFSAEKVDTMIVQAIALLDELDKEVNIYAMRVKEWYGWHFPEMVKIINDNMKYCRVIQAAGFRNNILSIDLSSILDEQMEQDLKNMAKISMGSDITQQDLDNISFLSEQVLELSDYRSQLYEYLRNRMMAIAPTLTMMVGELVGARLLAHAGSLVSLAKYPASTVQILGAEKALFRALKQKTDTPKYGLIYHASFVTASSQTNKAKIARSLACKTALATRIDAFTAIERSGVTKADDDEAEPQNEEVIAGYLDKMQQRINKLEGRKVQVKSKSVGGVVLSKHEFSGTQESYDDSKDIVMEKQAEGFDMKEVSTKKVSKKRKLADVEDVEESGKAEDSESDAEPTGEPPAKRQRTDEEADKKKKKKKKDKKEKKSKKKEEAAAAVPAEAEASEEAAPKAEKKKKDKKDKKKKKKDKKSKKSSE